MEAPPFLGLAGNGPRFALVRADPHAVRPTGHDSLVAGPGFTEEHRWWSLDEIAASGEVFAPRGLAQAVRELDERGPPGEPVDVGI